VWADEQAKWRPDLDLTVASYGSIALRAPNEKGHKVLATTGLRPEWRKHWDTVIFDEAHYLKGRDTKWAKAGLKIQGDRVWLATGTPIPNWANELFMLAQSLHPGDRRFTSYWRWVQEWFPIWKPKYGGTKVGQKLRADRTWEDFHADCLGGVYLARTWDDAGVQLPPLRHQVITLPMVPAQRKAYDEMKRDYCADVSGNDVVSWSSGSREANLIKMCTGLELLGGVGSAKLDYVKQVLVDWKGHPCVLVCHLRDTAALLSALCDKLRITHLVATGDTAAAARFRLCKRFQDGYGDVLIVTADAVAEGIQLQRAHRMVFVEKSYRPSRNEQVLKRIRRLGQEHPQLVLDLVCDDSIDSRKEKLLARKTDQQVKALRRDVFAANT
jgi:SNF2 family DNA or RNA helicase